MNTTASFEQRVKLCFYVPKGAADRVKAAVFAAGAGHIGNYDQCCWQTEGLGQFRPNDHAQPAIGTAGALSTVIELKIEIICAANKIHAVIAALKQAHPYEGY